MPKPFQYRSGSVIYFQGDPAEKIYILQNGKVSLVYQDIESGEDIRDSVQPGEFFGVKSALGRFPREENAIALADTSVMIFTVPEFEALAMQNSRIIMKMLKVFSNQMRRIHRQVSRLMEKKEEAPADGLFMTGEYYLKSKRFLHAKHVFSRYLTFYPSGKDALQASKNLELAENSLLRYGDGKGPSATVSNVSHGAAPTKPAMPAQTQSSGSSETASFYYDAVSLVSQARYQEAIAAFKTIVDKKTDPEWTMRSAYEIGRCMFLMKKFEDCVRYYSNMLTQYPKHSEIKDTMFIMGQCNEKLGRKDQAKAFYKKIISMGGEAGDGTILKAKQALQAIGGM